jgi:deazaflavin-dependent oxidoreductase (nitroreductase family)
MTDYNRSTVRLTHFGRKSGKPFTVTLWFAVIDGRVWIGSLSQDRSWVKNVRARGSADVDFGDGPRTARFKWIDRETDRERYADAVRAKYPLQSRIIGFFSRGKKRAAFETDITVKKS